MKFMEIIQKNLSKTVDTIQAKNKKITYSNRVRLLLRNEYETLNQSYVALGKYYYDNLRADAKGENANLCNVIDGCKERITKIKSDYEKSFATPAAKPECEAECVCEQSADAECVCYDNEVSEEAPVEEEIPAEEIEEAPVEEEIPAEEIEEAPVEEEAPAEEIEEAPVEEEISDEEIEESPAEEEIPAEEIEEAPVEEEISDEEIDEATVEEEISDEEEEVHNDELDQNGSFKFLNWNKLKGDLKDDIDYIVNDKGAKPRNGKRRNRRR